MHRFLMLLGTLLLGGCTFEGEVTNSSTPRIPKGEPRENPPTLDDDGDDDSHRMDDPEPVDCSGGWFTHRPVASELNWGVLGVQIPLGTTKNFCFLADEPIVPAELDLFTVSVGWGTRLDDGCAALKISFRQTFAPYLVKVGQGASGHISMRRMDDLDLLSPPLSPAQRQERRTILSHTGFEFFDCPECVGRGVYQISATAIRVEPGCDLFDLYTYFAPSRWDSVGNQILRDRF